jgi:hypothetical protein
MVIEKIGTIPDEAAKRKNTRAKIHDGVLSQNIAILIITQLQKQSPLEIRISGRRRLPVAQVRNVLDSMVRMQIVVREKITAAAPDEEKPAKSVRNFLPKTVWMMKYALKLTLQQKIIIQLNGLRKIPVNWEKENFPALIGGSFPRLQPKTKKV